MMIRPPYLRKGDTIGITAPAGWLLTSEITAAVEIIESWDLKIIFAKHLFAKYSSFAGTDKQRTADLQQMLDDDRINAILCARGGYGAIRIIEKINFDKFNRHPKWVTGFSDITVLHATIQQCHHTETIHGIMPRVKSGAKPDLASLETLHGMLFGEIGRYTLAAHSMNREGKAHGMLTGGNLSVLYSLAGTKYDPETKGRILFIEDLNEYLYHLDRMIMNMKLRGIFRGLSGLIVGGMLEMKGSSSGFGKPAYKIIKDAVAEYGYPVMFGFPAGHSHPNYALPLGREVDMEVYGKGSCVLKWKH